MTELRGIKKNEPKSEPKSEPKDAEPCQSELNQKNIQKGPSSSNASYRSKYSHIIGKVEKVEKVEKPTNKSFGLVSASSKRDRRTIEETQIAMREKKMKLKPS